VTSPSNSLQAAFVFAAQGDWARVMPAARQAVTDDPEDAAARALLALALTHTDKVQAVAEAKRAVGLGPELGLAHYALGVALLERDEMAAAERAAREALRLDPDADSYALLGQVQVRQRRWQDVLETTSRGLELQPEHGLHLNLRAIALANLGLGSAAESAVTDALAADPEDALSHANRGWLLLRRGNAAEALEKFKAALQVDPTLDFARAGMVEALKARSGIYRLLLKYTFWINSFQSRTRWFIVIGLYFAFRTVSGILRAQPSLWPVLGTLLGVYIVFVVTTWIATPISNLLIRLHPLGRLALSRVEIIASNILGTCIAGALLAGLVYLVTQSAGAGDVAVAAGLLAIPIGATSETYGGRGWRILLGATILIAFCAALAIALVFSGDVEGASRAVDIELALVVLFSWVAAFIQIKYQ
jgi:tetratricopeptide (TPR) repeat protein